MWEIIINRSRIELHLSTEAKNNVLKLLSRASASFQGQKKYRLFHHSYIARRCTDTNTLSINCEGTSYQPEHPSPSFSITQDNPVISSLTRKLSLAQVHVPIYQKDTFTDLLHQRKRVPLMCAGHALIIHLEKKFMKN